MDQSGDNSTGISGSHDNTASSLINPWDVAFGYGRRSCQGIAVAKTELWIAMAMILACFEIRPKTDPETMEPLLPKASWIGDSIRLVFYHVANTVNDKTPAGTLQRARTIPVQYQATIIRAS